MAVSTPLRYERAKVTPVSRERFPMPPDGGGAWPDNEPTRRAPQPRRPHWCGGRRRDRRTQEGQAAVPVGGGGAWPDNETTRFTLSTPGAAGVEGAGGTGGPGCGARGRRRDRRTRLRCPWAAAGPGRASRRRAERSSRRGRLAGGPPPTCTQSSPAPQQGATVPRTGAVPGVPAERRSNGNQPEYAASSVARCTPLRPASCAAWVRHENPSARYTASGCADRDGSSE